MKTKKYKNDFLFALGVLAVCSALTLGVQARKSSPKLAKDVEAVRSAFGKLVQAFNKRDAVTAMSFFADDVILVTPGVNPILNAGLVFSRRTKVESEYELAIFVHRHSAFGNIEP